MNRRLLIAGLLVSLAMGHASAQQQSRIPRLAIVSPSTPVGDMTETGTSPQYHSFFQRLRELGYVEGQDLAVQRYSAIGLTENFSDLAGEVVQGKPDLIIAVGHRMVRAIKTATETIPVVAIMSDPVAAGIVKNLARPGGNLTGITDGAGVEIDAKRLEFLHEVVPTASRLAYLASRSAWSGTYMEAMRAPLQRMKISVVGSPLEAPFKEAEYRRVFSEMVRDGVDVLIVNSQPENFTNRELIVKLAAEARLPTFYAFPDFVRIGGFMAYGYDLTEHYRHMADQVHLVLSGTKPGDIPFYQPTKFALTINLKTAKALGIMVPPTLLIAADEVIE